MVGVLNSLGKVERAAERALNLFRLSREGDRIGSAIAQSLRAALYPVLAPEEQGWIDRIEALRTELYTSETQITRTDYGAGEHCNS